MDIDKASRIDLECEIINNDELYNYLGGLDEIAKLNDDELRDKIGDWIIDGDETHWSCK